MVTVFGRYVVVCDHETYICQPCLRSFHSKSAILAHCRSTSAHEWCERCKRVFLTEHAKQNHIKLSSSHSICILCDHRPDFASRSQLDEHCDDVHFPCRNGKCNIVFRTNFGLREHLLSKHFACEECLRIFDSQNSHDQHMKSHAVKKLECPVCDRSFARLSFVLLHLERSRCSSIQEVNGLASEIVNHSYHLNNFINDDGMFCCENCDSSFVNLSSLYQHVGDTPDCSTALQRSGSLHSVAQYIFRNIR